MATTRWRSSLANVEARMRRSLGIAGPIDLALSDPPILTPVAIADDLTRPGCASDLRGRRWAQSHNMAILAAANGSHALVCNAPNGAVIDSVFLSPATQAAPATFVELQVRYFTVAQVAAAVIPYAVVTRAGFNVDPMNSNTDQGPCLEASSGIVAIGAGQPIWDGIMRGDGLGSQLVPLDLWLPNGAGLMIGNVSIVLAADLALTINYRGRWF
jgi:hypothetical protein